LSGEPAGTPALLRGIDRASFAVALAARLRSRGVVVGASAVGDFARALGAAPVGTRSRLYWTARVTLARRRSDLEVFDAVFDAVFDPSVLAVDPHARRTSWTPAGSGEDRYTSVRGPSPAADETGTGLPWVTLPPAVGEADDSDSLFAVPERLPSEVAGLVDVPFEQLSLGQMQIPGRWIELAIRDRPTRRTRRMTPSDQGHRVAIRATIAASRSTGWEPVHLVHVRAVHKPRRVVMLCDVSQSMQAQAGAYLHLMRALVTAYDAEVFAFSTTATRLTTVLAHRSAEVAVDQASAKVVDRFGGTRIASSIASVLSSVHGGTMRGAVVVIASDGWDADTPDQLAAAMARLRRRAHRVIWMNPRAGAPGYEPSVATMAAALPYCDVFLPADTFRALAAVVDEISRPRSAPATPAGQGPRRRR
jgi:uncharacterized protein with von Willebrand factor type A (vWA) domain